MEKRAVGVRVIEVLLCILYTFENVPNEKIRYLVLHADLVL